MSALEFKVVGRSGKKARSAEMKLPHFTCQTPMFMPVGTQGTIKGLTSEQLIELDCHLILGNTYHLSQRPGSKLIAKMGGLHKFINWPRNMLTDSGGFQMVSLLDLAEITEEGVTFKSPHDGTTTLLRPEDSIRIQNEIGADIMMALDDVVSSTTTGPRVEEAMHRTIRWIDRCITAHGRPADQNLFGIIQGGLDKDLRRRCVAEMLKRDASLPGYAIGGLSGGEAKEDFWPVVSLCTDLLPSVKPRYCMGVGYSLDIVVCVALGVDMFDCVFPCRTARFGTALIMRAPYQVQLRQKQYANDHGPVDPDCDCRVCKTHTRAYISHLIHNRDPVAGQLLTYHNVAFMMRLMREMRTAIREDRFNEWVQGFVAAMYPDQDQVPQWARDALASVDIAV